MKKLSSFIYSCVWSITYSILSYLHYISNLISIYIHDNMLIIAHC